jgi:hypothetical protein
MPIPFVGPKPVHGHSRLPGDIVSGHEVWGQSQRTDQVGCFQVRLNGRGSAKLDSEIAAVFHVKVILDGLLLWYSQVVNKNKHGSRIY